MKAPSVAAFKAEHRAKHHPPGEQLDLFTPSPEPARAEQSDFITWLDQQAPIPPNPDWKPRSAEWDGPLKRNGFPATEPSEPSTAPSPSAPRRRK